MAKKHLNFKELCSMSLLDQAIWHEEKRHGLRMAEIQKMAKALNALEAERATIERNGCRLFGESFSRPFAFYDNFTGAVLTYSGLISSDDTRLVTALLQAGWTVLNRDGGPYPSPLFRKGRVKLRVSCMGAAALATAENAAAQVRETLA